MKNFWLNRKEEIKKEEDLKKKIEYINKLLMEFNHNNDITVEECGWDLDL